MSVSQKTFVIFPHYRVSDQAYRNNMALNQSCRGRYGDFVYTGKQNTSCIENFINVRETINSKLQITIRGAQGLVTTMMTRQL